MPIASPYYRLKVVLFGTLPSAQTWSVGVSMSFVSSPTAGADLNAYAEALWTDAKATPNVRSLLALAGNTVTFQGVRVYAYAAGQTKASAMGQSQSASMVGTGTSTSQHPNQCAVVATHLSATLGRKSTGRAYLPLTSIGMTGTDGNFLSTATVTIATGWANTLSAWNLRRLGGQAGVVCVYSPTTGGSAGITAVRVDSIYDTVRARRDKVIAASKSTLNVVVG